MLITASHIRASGTAPYHGAEFWPYPYGSYADCPRQQSIEQASGAAIAGMLSAAPEMISSHDAIRIARCAVHSGAARVCISA